LDATDQNLIPNNSKVIHIVAATVCASVLIGVISEAICVIFKIPDMGGPVSGGFTHTVDTLVGAAIAMLINTRPQQSPPTPPADTAGFSVSNSPAEVTVVNPPNEPVPVAPQPEKP
jgi:hypothetical protein